MPTLTQSEIKQLLQNHYGLGSVSCKELVGEMDQNVFVRTDADTEFILKVAHPQHSLEHLEMENQAMTHCSSRNFSFELPHVNRSLRGEEIVRIGDKNMRLLTWVKGRLWSEVNPHNEQLCRNLGKSLGSFQQGLKDFDDPHLQRRNKWDPTEVNWVKEELAEIPFDAEQRQLIRQALNRISENQSILQNLPEATCYLDANDNNIIVGENSKIKGFIDFGDIFFTHRINELAIALAYACMHKPDPIRTAQHIISGFHEVQPLSEDELKVLFGQTLARLVISVSFSCWRSDAALDNPYLKISENAAWNLISKLLQVHPRFAEMCFRDACGIEPSPKNRKLKSWLADHHSTFFPILGPDVKKEIVTVFDWSVGSLELGNVDQFHDVPESTHYVFSRMEKEGSEIGIGRYNEPRPVYSTDEYAREGNEGPEWRTVHLGIDLFLPAGSPLCAPLDGEVVICVDDAGDKEYGPLLVLKHQMDDDSFYTLYGHNDPELLTSLKVGDLVKKGDRIALIGNYPENGNWVPHVHFQLISDLLDFTIDFPGVAFPSQRDIWCSMCPDPNLMLGLKHPELIYNTIPQKQILEQRKQRLGPNLSLSYNSPLHIIRGYKQYLFDEVGRRYLDTVNNVPHVGHQHPRVVKAAQKQMAVLNTNTRYLHEKINQYSEELLATLPDHLDVIYFTNSGSEANELALRMARTFSGMEGLIAVEHGYHGSTGLLVDISSYKFDGKGGFGKKDFVELIPAPDQIRGYFQSVEKRLPGIASGLMEDAVLKMGRSGIKPAAFIHETILSCGGQLIPHENYFKELYETARQHEILMIADEVQTGLGRVGEFWWAFELFGLQPDIVTMGKPIGNGHPLGAVATTRKVAEAFNNGMEYFNTFAGNPVSCAIGLEVLAVVKDEGLMEHAIEMRKKINNGFEYLQEQFPIIGDFRGHGLFLGIELFENPELKTPATRQTEYLLNRMKDHCILMSSDGPFHNVLKIKPPLCIQRNDIERLISTLEKVLNEDEMQIQELRNE